MLKRNISILLFSIIIISCNFQKKQEVERIIENFYKEKSIDKRETIFTIDFDLNGDKLIIKGETDNLELKNELIAALNSSNIIDKIIVLPDSTIGPNDFGIINLSVANLRSKPQHSAELATQALLGTPVKILKTKNGWFLVQTPDKYISWIDSDGIFPITKTELEMWKNSRRILFLKDYEAIYKDEKLEIPISDVTMGNILDVVKSNSDYLKVKFPDGRIGFTSPDNWVDFNQFKNEIKADTCKIRHLAERFTGRPYLWGGTSAHAMDCSGFVKTVYFMNGIILARDASLQVRHGEFIQTSVEHFNFQMGDLLFFGQKALDGESEKVTHVALALGNSEYIHAAGRVKTNSFNSTSKIYSDFRKNSFVRARRIIGSEDQLGIQTLKNHPWY